MRQWIRLLQQLPGNTNGMVYQGDVFDSPPLWLRAVALLACGFGGCCMVYFLLLSSLVVYSIVVGSGLLLAIYLVLTVQRASHTALVAVLYWGLLGVLAVFLPIQL